MHELPVIATTSAAYRLVLRELPTIFRLSWAMLFIVALVQFLLARTVLAQMASALGRGDILAAAAIGRDPVWLTLKFGADAIGTAIVAVAIHELVLFADHKPGHYFHLAFGRREALFALLGAVLALIVVPFATIVISPFGEPTAGLGPFFATLAFIVGIYVSVRLWPVLPVIVVNGHIDALGAWRLTRRRFWSLLALAVLGSIPIGLVALVIDSVLPPFDSIMDAITGPRVRMPALVDAANAVRRAQKWLPARALFDFTTSIVYTAIAVALISYAYKTLIGRRLDEPLSPQHD